jgi:RNA polymerase sigma-70 factor (ECF subfamily)
VETIQIIWSDLGERLRRFIGKRVSDAHAVDDITQDVLLKLQSQLGDLPPDDKLPAWLFRVARNAIVDYYRSRAVREHVDVTDHEPVAATMEADDQADAAAELTPCLLRMVELLPEPYREALKLADFQGRGQQEVADLMGISLSGAKSRVQRARTMLREMIYDCCQITRDGRGNVLDFARTERSARYCGGDDGKAQCSR